MTYEIPKFDDHLKKLGVHVSNVSEHLVFTLATASHWQHAREKVLFIGTQFSNLLIISNTPATR